MIDPSASGQDAPGLEEQRKADKLGSLATLAGGIAYDFDAFLAGLMELLTLARMSTSEDRVLAYLTDMERATLGAQGLTSRLRAVSHLAIQ